jgi:Phage replication protein CRI
VRRALALAVGEVTDLRKCQEESAAAAAIEKPGPGRGTSLPASLNSLPGDQVESRGGGEPPSAGLRCRFSNTAPFSQVRDSKPLTLRDSGVTIDWLTVIQDHDSVEVCGPRERSGNPVTRAFPVFGSDLLLFVDLESGELKAQAVKSYQCEGSYDSRLLVRSDGRRVEVSGNPSRWAQPHSLDGLVTISECLELYNAILSTLGLPGFSSGCSTYPSPRLLQRGDSIVAEGCRITRLDLANLWETGGPGNDYALLRGLAQVTHRGKVPMVYGKGETVAWGGGSRHVYVKYYLKGPELLKHGGPEASEAARWAGAVGLVRHEVTLKSMWLRKMGLERPELWTPQGMVEVMRNYSMHERVGVCRGGWSYVYQDLVEKGVPTSRARRAQESAYAYMSGHVFRTGENISRSAFYRLRGDLRKVGIDISAPLNVSALHVSVKTVEMRPANLPLGFRRVG